MEVLGGNDSRTQALVLAGLELLLVARPAGAQAGGDLYCVHSCGDRALAKIVLVDISGHGERSAFIARALHHLLHRYSQDTQPTRVLDLVNRQFPHFAPSSVLATSLCTVYDSRRSELRYAYGGQPRILFWQAGQRQWTNLAPPQDSPCGLPFGVTLTGCYEEKSISLRPADMLLMFSDGVPETRSLSGTLLQPEGVLHLAQECTEQMPSAFFPLAALADAFLRRLQDFHGGSDFEDDLTLLWLRRLPGDRPAPTAEPF